MGMVVRTNMAAINANNQLANASKAQANGMQKLASGFKINKAADDASGLSISEKMKAQIKALDTAKDNCEDGANLIQTAEGYMNETHDMLNRMVELSEKAANGVLEDTDRDALQDEMNQLCGEIDRMATTANFNGRKLLDGSIGSSGKVKITSDPETGKTGYSVDAAEKEVTNKFDASLANAIVSTTGAKDNGSGTAVAFTATDISGVAADLGITDTIEAGELTKKILTAVQEKAAEDKTVSKDLDILKKDLDDKKAVLQEKLDDLNKATEAGTATKTDLDAVTNAQKDVDEAQDLLNTGNDVTATKLNAPPTANANVAGGVAIKANVTVYVNKAGDVYTVATADKANDERAKELDKDLYSEIDNEDGWASFDFKVDVDTETKTPDEKEGIKLQIGETSTAADKLEVKIGSFHTDTLLGGIDGFKNLSADKTNETDASATAATMKNETATYKDGITIDISDQNKASAAADALRQVSNYVSDQRGKLGAQQNRLDHTVNNLSTASENVSAANSRIRDTDMAKEMMAYTSKNVIAQAAQSMLAQANSQPQNVLSLLQ